jgi:hypothetical protein
MLACLAVLLVALPAQAAPAQTSHAWTVAQWLGSIWADLTRFTVRPGAPAGTSHKSKGGIGTKDAGGPNGGGSCLDPNGVCTIG